MCADITPPPEKKELLLSLEELKAISDKTIARVLEATKGKENEGWQSIGEKDSMKMYKKITNDSPIHSVKGIGLIRADPKLILSYTKGVEKVKDYDQLCIDAKILQTFDDSHDVIYASYSLGMFFLYNREFIFLENRTYSERDGYVVACVTVPFDYPAVYSNVRGEMLPSGWVIKEIEPGLCEVTYMAQVDPKGWIPTLIVNLVASDALASLPKIRNILTGSITHK